MSVDAPSVLPQTRSHATLLVRHRDGGSRGVLELSGEADIATLFLLMDGLVEAVTTSPDHLVVDVSELRFCDVHSAHMILTASRTAPVSVTGATGSVKRVLDLLDALQQGPHTTHCVPDQGPDHPIRGSG